MLEKQIESKVSEYAKRKGILSFKFNSMSSRSVPDRIFIAKDIVFFIEFKRLGCKPTAKQALTISQFIEHGIAVYVVDNVESGKEVINKYKGEQKC